MAAADALPVPSPDDAAVVVAAPGDGPGYWAGGPGAALAADGPYWLAYRLRRPLGVGRGSGVLVSPAWVSPGTQECQSAVAVELEQVVDRALKAPLRAGGWLAADQYLAAVLDGADLAEHRLDDRFAPAVDRAAVLGPSLARHPLFGGGVLRDRPARRWRLRLVVLETARRDVGVQPMLPTGRHVLFGEVAAVGGGGGVATGDLIDSLRGP